MKTYYLEFRAQEAPFGDAGSPSGESLVRFWVVDRDPDGALRRANHYLVQNGWQPAGLEHPPMEVATPLDDANAQEVAFYEQAQRYGIAMAVAD